MQLPKELTTVTKLSKTLAIIAFIVIPLTSFNLGTRYQNNYNKINEATTKSTVKSQNDLEKIVFLTILQHYRNDKKLFVVQNSGTQTLFISNLDMSPASTKRIYESGLFVYKAFFDMQNVVMNYSESGSGGQVLLFTVDGAIITDSLSSLNPELKDYNSISASEIDTITKTIKVAMVSEKNKVHADAKIDYTSGKLLPGSIIITKRFPLIAPKKNTE